MGGEERNKSNFLPKSQAFFIYISLWLYLKEKWWPASSMHDSLFIFQPVGLSSGHRRASPWKGGRREKENTREGEWKGGRERVKESGFGPCAL